MIRRSNHLLSLPVLLAVALSFPVNLIVLTSFFSQILAHSATKSRFSRSGFIVSFSGLAVGIAFALGAQFLPGSLGIGDIGVIMPVITWVMLFRHYYETGWTESIFVALIAAILYVVILAIASSFALLLQAFM